MDRLEGSTSIITKTADELKDEFSSEYMSQQMELMLSLRSSNPTQAIGLAKELIESCCKTILDDFRLRMMEVTTFLSLPENDGCIEFIAENVQATAQEEDAIKSVLGESELFQLN